MTGLLENLTSEILWGTGRGCGTLRIVFQDVGEGTGDTTQWSGQEMFKKSDMRQRGPYYFSCKLRGRYGTRNQRHATPTAHAWYAAATHWSLPPTACLVCRSEEPANLAYLGSGGWNAWCRTMGTLECLLASGRWQDLIRASTVHLHSTFRMVLPRTGDGRFHRGVRWSKRKSWWRCRKMEMRDKGRSKGVSCSICRVLRKLRACGIEAWMNMSALMFLWNDGVLTLARMKSIKSWMIPARMANSSVPLAISFDSYGTRCLRFTFSTKALRIWSGWMSHGDPVPFSSS